MGDLEERSVTPLNITIAANAESVTTPLPEKTRGIYENVLERFMEWRKTNDANSFSENVILAYISDLSTKFKPPTLWSYYSMLKSTLNAKYNIQIGQYAKVRAFIKRKNKEYVPKKMCVLKKEHILKFIKEAPDAKYLLTKVILLFGVAGGLRRDEIYRIKSNDIEDLNTILVVSVKDSRNKISRKFTVSQHLDIYRKYTVLRPSDCPQNKFFINYQKGKCTRQVIGINKIGRVPSEVAAYLKLPNANKFTGHCLRRAKASSLVDDEGDIQTIKNHNRLISLTGAEAYMEESSNRQTWHDMNENGTAQLSDYSTQGGPSYTFNTISKDEQNFIEDIQDIPIDHPTEGDIKVEVSDIYDSFIIPKNDCSEDKLDRAENIENSMLFEDGYRDEASVSATYMKKKLELMERDVKTKEQLVQVVRQGFNTLFELLGRR